MIIKSQLIAVLDEIISTIKSKKEPIIKMNQVPLGMTFFEVMEIIKSFSQSHPTALMTEPISDVIMHDIKIIHANLDLLLLHKSNAVKSIKENSKTINLNTSTLHSEFDSEKSILKIDGHEIEIPPFKNEFYLCKVMFEKEIGQPVSWDEIYEEMTSDPALGTDKIDRQKLKRKLYDTREALHTRIRTQLGNYEITLFEQVNKTVIRKF